MVRPLQLERDLIISPGLTLDGSTTYTKAQQVVVSNVHIFSSNMVNEARFGYNSLDNSIAQQLAALRMSTARSGRRSK